MSTFSTWQRFPAKKSTAIVQDSEARGDNRMTDHSDLVPEIVRARGDIAAERACLRCRTVFWSEGFGQRVCPRCKSSTSWRSAVASGSGNGHRRSSGRKS